MIKSAYATCLRNDISSTDTRKCLRGLRNHENFQVLRLHALFPVPLSSYSFHFKKKRCSLGSLYSCTPGCVLDHPTIEIHDTLLKFMGVWQIVSNLIGSIIYLLIYVVKNGPLNGEGPVFAKQFGIRNGKVVTQLQKISLNSNKINSISRLSSIYSTTMVFQLKKK